MPTLGRMMPAVFCDQKSVFPFLELGATINAGVVRCYIGRFTSCHQMSSLGLLVNKWVRYSSVASPALARQLQFRGTLGKFSVGEFRPPAV